VRVVWEEAKNVANQKKHRVSFEEASALFSPGVNYPEIFDDAHSETEDRFIAIGPIRAESFSSCGQNGKRMN